LNSTLAAQNAALVKQNQALTARLDRVEQMVQQLAAAPSAASRKRIASK
jgi:hypothetical protein